MNQPTSSHAEAARWYYRCHWCRSLLNNFRETRRRPWLWVKQSSALDALANPRNDPRQRLLRPAAAEPAKLLAALFTLGLCMGSTTHVGTIAPTAYTIQLEWISAYAVFFLPFFSLYIVEVDPKKALLTTNAYYYMHECVLSTVFFSFSIHTHTYVYSMNVYTSRSDLVTAAVASC